MNDVDDDRGVGLRELFHGQRREVDGDRLTGFQSHLSTGGRGSVDRHPTRGDHGGGIGPTDLGDERHDAIEALAVERFGDLLVDDRTHDVTSFARDETT